MTGDASLPLLTESLRCSTVLHPACAAERFRRCKICRFGSVRCESATVKASSVQDISFRKRAGCRWRRPSLSLTPFHQVKTNRETKEAKQRWRFPVQRFQNELLCRMRRGSAVFSILALPNHRVRLMTRAVSPERAGRARVRRTGRCRVVPPDRSSFRLPKGWRLPQCGSLRPSERDGVSPRRAKAARFGKRRRCLRAPSPFVERSWGLHSSLLHTRPGVDKRAFVWYKTQCVTQHTFA